MDDNELLALEQELGISIPAPWNEENGDEKSQNQDQDVTTASSLTSLGTGGGGTKTAEGSSKHSKPHGKGGSKRKGGKDGSTNRDINQPESMEEVVESIEDIAADFSTMDLSKFKSSTERNVWSHRNKIWKQYATTLPRTATKKDLLSNRTFAVDHYPNKLDLFLGTHHEIPISSFRSLISSKLSKRN